MSRQKTSGEPQYTMQTGQKDTGPELQVHQTQAPCAPELGHNPTPQAARSPQRSRPTSLVACPCWRLSRRAARTCTQRSGAAQHPWLAGPSSTAPAPGCTTILSEGMQAMGNQPNPIMHPLAHGRWPAAEPTALGTWTPRQGLPDSAGDLTHGPVGRLGAVSFGSARQPLVLASTVHFT